MSKKSDETTELEQQVGELIADLQRTRADFENYRKRVELEKEQARAAGKSTTILKLLPVVDNIERAIGHLPNELKDNTWAQGVAKLTKNLESALEKLEVRQIKATPGEEFNPDLHEAIQFDNDAEGEKEVIAKVLQAGYTLDGRVIRHVMVEVTRK